MTTPRKQSAGSRLRGSNLGHFTGFKRRDSGAALLIVLVFILILAVVLVTFLSNSQQALRQTESSSTILKTQMLSDVALAAVLDDLTDEMESSSDDGPGASGVMDVTSPQAMRPARVLKDDNAANDPKFANLVKQSAQNKPFFPKVASDDEAGKVRASGDGTLVESLNQRKISAERWNAPKLLGDATGLGSFRDTQLPDWIYITRKGVVDTGGDLDQPANKALSNTNYVLGRYAYNIYEVDGLLDINVAGFDPLDSRSATAAVSKGSSALADLRAIPGLESTASIGKIIDWRNKQSKADYPAMIAGLKPSDPSTADVNQWGEPAGFQLPYTDGVRTDNRFFGRQDLLKYFRRQFLDGSENNALPFLTTFSADLDQPSFRPDSARPMVKTDIDNGGNDAYAKDSLINPNFLTVRAGDEPVARRRFPLSLLRHVVPNPDPGSTAIIQDNFGLQWSGNSWVYSKGAPIKKLDELGGEEPNMMELLKAAITVGSLGGQASYAKPESVPLQDRDSSIDYQVMRIAACIIDQYDADSYPTLIKFGPYTVRGVEDLPYLYGIRIAPYRQQQLVPEDSVTSMSNYPKYTTGPLTGKGYQDLYRNVVLLQPIIWNPHAPATGSHPTAFRVTAATLRSDGTIRAPDVVPQSRKPWWANVGTYVSNWPSKTGNPRDSGEKRSFNPNEDFVTFSVTPDVSSPSSFREPYTLKSPDYPPGSNARAYSGAHSGVAAGEVLEPTLGADEQNDIAAGESSTVAIGFRTGWCWSGPYYNAPAPNQISSSNPTYLQLGLLDTGDAERDGGIDFELQYQSSTGEWVTYDTYSKFSNHNENYRLDRLNSGVATINPRLMRYYLRADPRVDRYGMRAPLLQPNVEGWRQGESLRKDDGPGVISQAGWPTDAKFRFTVPSGNDTRYVGLLSENRPTNVVRYTDPDNVQRVAMAGLYDGTGGKVGLPMAQGNFASRPIILNRPFRSVAELGHVLRDQPWKQLDFFSPQSGDAALLDIFCLYEPEDASADPVVSGRVNLNSPRREVIEALLRGVEITEGSGLTNTDAATLAQALVNWTSSTEIGKGPLRNRAELVGRFVSEPTPGTYVYNGFASSLDNVLAGANRVIASRRQNVLRALVDPTTTRTWSFLIDLIVQDGQFSGTDTTGRGFTVRGEKRLWVHVSLDRFTGDVVAQRVEEVHE